MAGVDDRLKMMSLLVFTFQNAAFVLLMRWSKVLDTHYNSTVAVRAHALCCRPRFARMRREERVARHLLRVHGAAIAAELRTWRCTF